MEYQIGGHPIKNICIIGAGNEGHYLMALLGSDCDLKVSVLTSNADNFSDVISCHNVQSGHVVEGKLAKVSSSAEEVIPESDMIISTVPSNGCESYLRKIYPWVKNGCVICFLPGTGGVEFLTKEFITEKHCIVVGSQRVPSGTKVTKRGASVDSLDKRKDLRIATLPKKHCADACEFFTKTLDIKTVALPNYIAVTFTPSNPILHTSRLYGLFHDYVEGRRYDSHLSFYKNWDDLSSEILLGCDGELKQCMDKLPMFDFSGIQLLRYHYEIAEVEGNTDVEKMTRKIRSLIYLKDYAPMKQTEDGHYLPDFGSRYFVEDFPFGLAILKGYCKLCGIETPYMDKILGWYDGLFSAGLYVEEKFVGKGVKGLPVPQNYGINTLSELVAYYDKIENGN